MAFNSPKRNTIISFSVNFTVTAGQCPTATLVDGLTVTAPSTNTALVYIGGSDLTASNGYQVPPGATVQMAIDNPKMLWVLCQNGSDVLNGLGF